MEYITDEKYNQRGYDADIGPYDSNFGVTDKTTGEMFHTKSGLSSRSNAEINYFHEKLHLEQALSNQSFS
ncbi:MAG: hypothetical protein H7331_05020 [Bacteroidia bacterium]|nr:hypothetical protein [Bacteroidia bacterium]